jgi:hypothetical protein
MKDERTQIIHDVNKKFRRRRLTKVDVRTRRICEKQVDRDYQGGCYRGISRVQTSQLLSRDSVCKGHLPNHLSNSALRGADEDLLKHHLEQASRFMASSQESPSHISLCQSLDHLANGWLFPDSLF